MSTGLQGQKIMYTTLFVGKVCRKNPGFDKDKTDVMFGLTLYDFASFISLYVPVKIWKFLLKIKLWASLTKAWSPRVILFFFLFPLFLSLFFFQDDSLEHRSFIAFCVNQGRSSLFLSLFLLSLSSMPSSWWYPWILLGLDPGICG